MTEVISDASTTVAAVAVTLNASMLEPITPLPYVPATAEVSFKVSMPSPPDRESPLVIVSLPAATAVALNVSAPAPPVKADPVSTPVVSELVYKLKNPLFLLQKYAIKSIFY